MIIGGCRRQPRAEGSSDILWLRCVCRLWFTRLSCWLITLLLLLVLHLLLPWQPIERELWRPLCREPYAIDKIHKVAEVLKPFVMVCLRLVTCRTIQLMIASTIEFPIMYLD